MRNFFNNLNLVVSIIAGICTITLFFVNPPFHTSNKNADVSAETSNEKDVPDTVSYAGSRKDSVLEGRQSAGRVYPRNDTTSHKKYTAYKKAAAESTAVKKQGASDSGDNQTSVTNGIADFFITFIKTPVVFYALLFALIGCFFVGIFQFFQNLFTKFEYGFDATVHVWNWGWNDVTLGWWWDRGVGWHLALSIVLWIAVVFWSERNN